MHLFASFLHLSRFYLENFNCFDFYILILYFIIFKSPLITRQQLNILLLQLEQTLLARCGHINDIVTFGNKDYVYTNCLH